MGKMIFGRYIPVESFLHKMDPRAKLIITILFIAVVFLANNGVTYALLGIFTLLAVYSSRIPIKFIIGGFKLLFWLIIITFFLHIFFTRGGDVIVQIGPVKVYEHGLRQGTFISLRFFFLIIMTGLLTLTTTPIEITDGMESLLKPLKKVRFPVHEFALMMSIALRFIPTLMDETDKIMKAQVARGVDFSHGSLKERAQSFIPLLIPLFVNSFKRAEELAIAMEARGYRGGEGRTKYRLLKWGIRDTLAIITLLLLALALMLFRS